MFALVYASQALIKFNEEELFSLCQQSITRNRELNITGYLYFNDNRFFQYIEGNEENVMTLMQSLEKDERHKITAVMHDHKVPQRRFPSWSMQYISKDGVYLEDVIDSYFEFMTASPHNYARYAHMIWKAVENMAQLHNQLYG